MQVVIIGTGNVATVLGRKIKAAGHLILQVAGRTKTSVDMLATELSAAPVYDFGLVSREADIYLIAVSDTALYTIAEQFYIERGIVLHTAGSVSMDVLIPFGRPYGILYPLQSLRKEMDTLPPIPLLTEAMDDGTLEIVNRFAATISDHVEPANGIRRMELHLAAVITSNFTNHLYALADEYCKKKKLTFSLLLPLIEETATRIRKYAPASMQTGPAIRGDEVTIERHRQLISDMPELQKLYDVLNESIRNTPRVQGAE